MQLVASAGLVPTSARSLPRLALLQPHDVAEAVAVLAEAEDPIVLAGGTDLVARFNEGLQPRELVDLSRLAELRSIEFASGALRIGAGVAHGVGSTHAAVVERAPGFARAWARIANPRIRFRATLGGNVMARRVRYECSLLLTALQAQLEFATPAGRSAMSPQDVWAGRVPARSLLTAASIETSGLVFFRYERSLRPLMTLAVALRQTDAGLLLSCAVASEFLQPVLIDQPLPGMRPDQIARNAKAIARDLFARLPAGFADPVLSNPYARTAGAVLLARQLESIADD